MESKAVSVEEFGVMLERVLRRCPRFQQGHATNPEQSRPNFLQSSVQVTNSAGIALRRVAVWVNGSASSIALAVLATKYFRKRDVTSRVFAVMTSGRADQTPYRHLADSLRRRGVEVIDAQPSPKRARSMSRSFEELPFALREMVRQNTRTLLTWHTESHAMCYHICNLVPPVANTELGLLTEIESYESESAFTNVLRTRAGTFDVFRPLLTVSASRMEATCRELGVEPVDSDEVLCRSFRWGKSVLDEMAPNERHALKDSMILLRKYLKDRTRLGLELMSDVLLEVSPEGMMVLRRANVARALNSSAWIRSVMIESLVKLARALTGQVKPEPTTFAGRLDQLFGKLEIQAFRSMMTRFGSLGEEDLYIRHANRRLAVENLASHGSGLKSRVRHFKSGDLVAMSRVRDGFVKEGNFRMYKVKIGINKPVLWDNRFVVGAFIRPPKGITWPSSVIRAVNREASTPAAHVAHAQSRFTYKDTLLLFLDKVCQTEDSQGEEDLPFEVVPMTYEDLEDLLLRHEDLRKPTEPLPAHLLWTIPVFKRDGEILAVPAFNINYEPFLFFRAHLIHFPCVLPPALDHTFAVHRWT